MSSLIAGGITEVPVIRRPRVGYIPTGSELVPPGTVPKRGQNIDSNSALVKGLLELYGAEPVMYEIVSDDKELLSAALNRAIAETDVVLMSGGSSKGEEDYTTRLFEEHGALLTHWVKAVPGRPMSVAFDRSTGTPLINLSGPPAACLNGMLWCVNAVVGKLTGRAPLPSKRKLPSLRKTSTPRISWRCSIRSGCAALPTVSFTRPLPTVLSRATVSISPGSAKALPRPAIPSWPRCCARQTNTDPAVR